MNNQKINMFSPDPDDEDLVTTIPDPDKDGVEELNETIADPRSGDK